MAVAESLVAGGARRLVSFGLAGGLAPALPPGTLVLATGVADPDGICWPVAAAWRNRMAARLRGTGVGTGPVVRDRDIVEGLIAGADQPIATVAEKAALQSGTGALAVDMESHAVGQVAAVAGLPFLVVRAIADPAGRALPAVALAGLGPDGRQRPLAVLAGLLRRPRNFAALLRLAADSRAAHATLVLAGTVIGSLEDNC